METLVIVGRLLVTACVLLFPQLLGVLLYLRIRRLKWFAKVVAVLTPAILFFLLSPIVLFAGIREAQAKGELTCGMPVIAAVLVLYAGTALELGIALILHGCWSRFRSTSSSA